MMTDCLFDGHGYRIKDQLSKEETIIGIDILPGRKNPCLFCQTRNELTPSATFKSAELAQKALRLLDEIAEGSCER